MAEDKKQKTEQKIRDVEITKELRESYLDYAMSVIVSRALPDVRDGLKPVQRRILWAMWDDGLTHGAKYRKSANVVGSVLGRYHPHGDTAVYDALARMAQDFSLRYPLIDGQGNWGSIDGDAPAAMRYTECRLSKIAEELLFDVEKETVDWQPNYDGSRVEPKCLPARLPALLLNGTVGIAVGMATSIPPHNLGEVVDAINYLGENPAASVKDLMKFISGPDFPTGGVIYGKSSLEEAYRTGKGSVMMRGVAEIEEYKKGGWQIIVTEIPYQVNKSTLIEKIAELVTSKKIEGVRDVRDESDREGLRIVVELKSDATPQKILNQLYEYTELQKNFHFNMLSLVGGLQPRVLSLKEILEYYLAHRREVVRRRAQFDLKKAEERAHVLQGLVRALSVIDKIISTIKKSKTKEEAQKNLIKGFKLTEIQANAILEMKLQTLAAMERERLEDELKEKKKIIADLGDLLKKPKRITGIIQTELAELKRASPEGRRTRVVAGGVKEFKEEDLVVEENVVVTVTSDGYVKRMPPTSFRSQKRGGKGTIGFELKEEDMVSHFLSASTHDNVLFFTDRGRAYQTKAYDIPVASRTAKGRSIHNFLEIPPTDKVTAVVSYSDKEASDKKKPEYLIMATAKGLIKKTPLSDFENVRRTGIIALKLKADDKLQWAKHSSGGDQIILATGLGQAVRFREKDVRPMGRSASGVAAIRLRKGDRVAGLDIIKREALEYKSNDRESVANIRDKFDKIRKPFERLLVVMANGFAKQTPLKDYKIQRRGGSGLKTAKVTPKTGVVISANIVTDETLEVLAFSSKGQALKTKLVNVRVAGRATQGVRIMNLEAGDSLVGIVCL